MISTERVMQRKNRGFTLIELMVVVAILAIIASIAYPSYIDFVVKSRRSAGAACLMELSQFMERYASTHPELGYRNAALPEDAACRTELEDHYRIDFSAGPDATSYTLAATPRGQQSSRDGQCGVLSTNQRGTKSVSGSYSGTPAKCF